MMSVPVDLPAIRLVASRFPGLRLLALHGSRARGDADVGSDWDFAYLGEEGLDELELRRRLCDALGTDHIDLADLARAGGLLRFRVAKDGVLLFERNPGAFEDFCYEAARFWFDVADIVRAEHVAILEALG